LNRQEALTLIQKSVKLAIAARDEFWADESNRTGRAKPLVAASVGPYGAYLAHGEEYIGNYGLSQHELMDFHRPRLKALIEAGADLLACETIPSLVEAQALAELLREFPATSAWISFSARDERHISEGQVFADCVKLLKDSPQISAIGINCTSPEYIPALIAAARKVTNKPLLTYPNSGERYDPNKMDWNNEPFVESFGEQARDWYEAGARLIGGCCRTTPEDIRVIAGWARNVA
jgi:homocysteine S-methyltransferase